METQPINLNPFQLVPRTSETSCSCPSHQTEPRKLISYTAPWSHNISLDLLTRILVPLHNLIPPHLCRHLLKWRAKIKSALYTRRALIALITRRLGRSEDLDCILIPLILEITLKVVWIEDQLLDYLEQVQMCHGQT